jgi:hypothetical protein
MEDWPAVGDRVMTSDLVDLGHVVTIGYGAFRIDGARGPRLAQLADVLAVDSGVVTLVCNIGNLDDFAKPTAAVLRAPPSRLGWLERFPLTER